MHSMLSPWRQFDFEDLRTALERMFEGDAEPRAWRMSVDVVEEDDKLVVHADLPGIKPDEVKIAVEGDVLVISGEHEESEEEKTKRFVRKERRRGSFYRSMPLPQGVKPEEIKAGFHDGVLEVRIPLPQNEPLKRIEITPTAG